MAKRIWKIWKNKAYDQWICYLSRLFVLYCCFTFNFNLLYFELKIIPKSKLWYSRAECNEKLLQIQFGVLRE